MEIRTDRLYIRNLQKTDWVQMKNIFIDFNRSPYVVYDRPLPTDDHGAKELTEQFVDNALFFAVFLTGQREMIGYVCFYEEKNIYDMGYCFHSSYHSRGYAYESTKVLIDYFIKEYGAKEFTAGTAINNVPSCKLLKKLGFVCVSTETVTFGENDPFEGGNFKLRSGEKIFEPQE